MKIPHGDLVLDEDAVTDCSVLLHQRTVYDIAWYLQLHPAGDQFIEHFCGDDGTTAFGAYHDIGLLAQQPSLTVSTGAV